MATEQRDLIIGLVDAIGSGGASAGGNEWFLVFHFVAWRRSGSEVIVEERRCELPVSETELDELTNDIEPYAIVEAELDRVSEGGVILLSRIVSTHGTDGELQALSAKLQDPASVRTISSPPFPLLTWTKYKCWEGEAVLAAWSGFQSRKGPYGAVDRDDPADGSAGLIVKTNSTDGQLTQYQSKAFQFQLDHGPEVVASVLNALLPYYRGLRVDWASFIEPERMAEAMPEVSCSEDFRSLIGLSQIHVHPYFKDDLGYVGLEFGCTWDEEHGFGVMLHGARVVSIGDAAVSFAWKPDEAE
jgi:hypothetical protein